MDNVQFLKTFFPITNYLPSMVGVNLAEKLFTTPEPFERRPVESNLLKTAETFVLKQDDINDVFVYRWGDKSAPIILFSHGWSASGTCFIKFIKPLLEKNFQVVAYDAIAHGDTTGATKASVTNWADTLHMILKELGSVHCIVGHSLGAGAIVVGSSFELKTDKVVLLSPVIDIVKQTDIFAQEFGVPKRILKKLHEYTWKRYKHVSSKYGDDWKHIFKPNITVPTLIFHDIDDEEAGIDDTRILASQLSDSRLIETNKLGHRRILLNPRVVSKTIDFITEN